MKRIRDVPSEPLADVGNVTVGTKRELSRVNDQQVTFLGVAGSGLEFLLPRLFLGVYSTLQLWLWSPGYSVILDMKIFLSFERICTGRKGLAVFVYCSSHVALWKEAKNFPSVVESVLGDQTCT